MTGATCTTPSSTMAKGLLTLSLVRLPKRKAPFWLKRKVTTGRLFWSKRRLSVGQVLAVNCGAREVCTHICGSAFRFSFGQGRWSPFAFFGLQRRINLFLRWDRRRQSCGGVLVCVSGLFFAHQSGTSTWPWCRMRSFTCSGFSMPGNCTAMRSTPCCWMTGSVVPSALTRRSTIFSDCWMADWIFGCHAIFRSSSAHSRPACSSSVEG